MPNRTCAAQGLDRLYAGRPIQRFWFLETVARMPYFSYISMLHLYESLGWWRAGAELRRVRPPQVPPARSPRVCTVQSVTQALLCTAQSHAYYEATR